MDTSPYRAYEDILIHGKYGTAYRLQDAVISLYNPHKYSFNRDNHWGGFDIHHREICEKLLSWFHEHGRNEPTIEAICSSIIAQREKDASKCLAELQALQAMNPEIYPAEDGLSGEDNYRGQLALLEYHVGKYRHEGFLG